MKFKAIVFRMITSLLCAGGAAASAQTVLIDFNDGIPGNGIHEASVRNGGFEEGSNGQTFAQTPVWSSYFSPEGDSSTLTQATTVRTGSLRGLASGWSGTGTRQQPSITIPASDWTIAAGDVFSVSVDWRNGASFSGQLEVILNVVDASGNPVQDLANHEGTENQRLLSRTNALVTNNQYQTFAVTSNPVPVGSPWIGNRVQLRILNSGPRTSFAIIDNVSLTATPITAGALTWVGTAGGGTWDLNTTAHWKNGAGNPATYNNNGVVTFDDSAATGSVALAATGIQPFSVTFANSSLAYTLSGEALSGAGTLTKTGSGDVTLLINQNLASTTISGGTLRIGNGGLLGSPGAGPIVNNAALVVARDGTVTFDGGISGSGTLQIQGPGTTVLAGNITQTGATTVSGGTLRAYGTLASSVIVENGAILAPGPTAASGALALPELTLKAGSRTLFRADYTSSDTITVTHPGGLTINGSHLIDLIPTQPWFENDNFKLFTYDTSLTGSIGNLQIGSAPHGSYSILDNSGEIHVQVNSVDSLVWSGNVDSNWNVNQTANWKLASDNSAAPFFTYDEVLFDDTAASTTVTVTETVPVGHMLFNFNSPTSYLLAGPGTLTGFGRLHKDGTGTLSLTANLENTGETRIFAGALNIGTGGTTGSLGAGGITNDGSLAFNRSDDIVIGNSISGGGTLTQQGTGSLTLGGTGQNTFTGNVTVSSGRLALAKATALGSSTDGAKTITVAEGARLDFNNYTNSASTTRSYSFRIAGAGDGSGALVNNAGTTISSFAGVLNLELTGDATIGGTARYDLGFANGVSGVVTGNGHTLTKTGTNQIQIRGDAGSSPLTIVVNQGILNGENHSNCFGGATGSVTVNSGAVLGAFGALSIPTPVTLNTGAILRAAGGAAATWTGSITLGGVATIDTPSFAKTISGVISGSGGFTKTGGQTLTLSAANTYTGPTNVNNGTLLIQQPCLNDTAAVTVAAGATLNLDFTGTDVVGSLTIAGVALAPGTYNATTHPGRLAGSGALQIKSSTSDYDNWAASFSLVGGSGDDDDSDGLTNFNEYAFGLNPTNPASVSPVTAPDKTAGTFTYTRRKPSLTGLAYTCQSSLTLAGWDPVTPVSEATNGGDPVETITVTLPPALLTGPELFLRVKATKP